MHTESEHTSGRGYEKTTLTFHPDTDTPCYWQVERVGQISREYWTIRKDGWVLFEGQINHDLDKAFLTHRTPAEYIPAWVLSHVPDAIPRYR